MVNRFKRLLQDARQELSAKRVERRLRTETLTHLAENVVELRARVEELESELDELRADSRRIAELRLLVEDSLVR